VPDRRAQLDKLVGQPESLARRVLGPPTDTTQSGDRLYLSYVDPGNIESFAGYDMFGGYGRYGTIGYRRLGFEAPITAYELRCETTLEVQQGVVVTYALKGDHCG
jgi:hypothetical protein